MRLAFVFALCAAAALGSTPAQIRGVTPTQVLFEYDAGDLLPCTLTVYDPYGNLVPDVDSSLFSGANLDTRSIISGSTRRFVVVGKRGPAELALDGVTRYSRALEAGATGTYSFACTSITYSGAYTTAEPALGHTVNDPLPTDPAHPGVYAWPTIKWGDRTQRIVDPYTGFLLRLLDSPRNSYVEFGFNQNFASATGGTGWTNASNALADDSAAATYSGTSQATLALEIAEQFPNDAVHGTLTPSANTFNALLNAWAATSGVQIQVCIAVGGSGVCTTDWITITLPVCTSACGGNRFNIISGTPLPLLGDWFAAEGGISTIDAPALAKRSGTVNRIGAAVTLASGDSFCLCWNAGATIVINGTSYTIASMNHDRSITLSGSPTGSDSNAPYSASNAFLLIRAATSASTTFFLQYGNFYYEVGDPAITEPGGDENATLNCAPIQVSGPGGEMGWHCNVGQILYWIGATSFSSTRLGYAAVPFHAGPPSWGGSCLQTFWDSADPNSLWCPAASGTHRLMLKATYTGSNTDVGDIQELQPLTSCGSSPCWTIANTTPPGSEIDTQIANFNGPAWNVFPAAFPTGAISLYGRTALNNSLMFLVRPVDNNDTIGWLCKFNLNTSLIDACASSWGHWPFSWQGLHGPLDLNNSIWADGEGHDWDGNWSIGANDIQGNGPYYALVISGAISGTPGPCGTQPPGNPVTNWPTGNNCVTVTIDGAPGDPSPAYYGTGTISTSGSTVTGSGTTFTASMSGQQLLVSSTYCNFTFVSATSGTCPGVPTVTNSAYKLYLENVNSGLTGNPAFSYLQNLLPRDTVCLAPANTFGCGLYGTSGIEFDRVLIVSSNTITLQRAWNGAGSGSPASTAALAAGAWLIPKPGSCQYGPVYPCIQARAVWNFIDDPNGLNIGPTQTIVVDPNDPGCCHGTFQGVSVNIMYNGCPTRDGDTQWCLSASSASPPAIFTSLPAYPVSMNPIFHGLMGHGSPDNVDEHPVHTQFIAPDRENGWIGAARPMLGDEFGGLTGSSSSHGVNTTGSLWKFTAAQTGRLRPRIFPTMAFAGASPLRDVSGPSSVITGTSADYYKHCIVLIAGECVSGSSVGDLYVNAPQIEFGYCPYNGQGNTDPGWESRGICVGDMGAHTMAVTQSSVRQADPDGRFSRRVTHALSRYQWVNPFWNPKSLPDGSGMIIGTTFLGGLRDSFLLVKLPPFPSPDGINRGDFIPTAVTIPTVAGADNAVVQFGYDTSFNCTSRNDPCVATGTTATWNATTPFSWASENPAGASCASGCVIYIPGISQRVLFAQYQIRNSGGTVIQTGSFVPMAVP